MSISEFRLDTDRLDRVGIEEAVFCSRKTETQIEAVVRNSADRGRSLLLTRLNERKFHSLAEDVQKLVDYESDSGTGIVGTCIVPGESQNVAVVTAGTSDLSVAKEAQRTLLYHGIAYRPFYDAGVAGLWRILSVEQELRQYPVVIVIAGMDAALASVVGGLIPSVVIAVPTSVGYGVAEGGRSALESILTSCAPGVVAVNIDNGYGAACAAIRILNTRRSSPEFDQADIEDPKNKS